MSDDAPCTGRPGVEIDEGTFRACFFRNFHDPEFEPQRGALERAADVRTLQPT